MKKIAIFLLAACLLYSSLLLAENAKQEPKAIAQQILNNLVEDINRQQFDKVSAALLPNVTILLENGQIFHSRSQWNDFIAQPTFQRDEAHIKKVTIKNLHVDDEVSQLDPTTFVVSGFALFSYEMDKRNSYRIPTRWVAVFHKEKNQWQLATFQNTVNILDNPILDDMKNHFYFMCLITLVLGIIIGLIWKRLRRWVYRS